MTPATISGVRVRVQFRTGDRAVIIGVAAIACYEKLVRDDEDLISNRVAHYRKTAPLLVDTIILITALHLAEKLEPEWDVFHCAVRYFRKGVDKTTALVVG